MLHLWNFFDLNESVIPTLLPAAHQQRQFGCKFIQWNILEENKIIKKKNEQRTHLGFFF
jgi:hypothetical protein